MRKGARSQQWATSDAATALTTCVDQLGLLLLGLGLQLLVVGLQLLDLGLRAAQLLLQLDLRLFGLRVGAKQLLVLGLQLLICGERAVQLGCGIDLEGAEDVGCSRA